MARETGLPSNQEFPASVSGVTGGFVSKAAGVGREGRRRQGLRGCALTPYPLYPRAYFFVGGREGPWRRLLLLKGGKRKDVGAGECPCCLTSLFDPPLFLPSSPSNLSLPIFSERQDSALGRASVGMGNLCLIANLGSLGESSPNSHSSKMDVR